MTPSLFLAGSTGKVGRAWAKMFNGAKDAPPLHLLGGSRDMDLRQSSVVETLGRQRSFDASSLLVWAAAFTDVDGCEMRPEEAEQINFRAVRELTTVLKRSGGALLFYSSDFVFDGTGPKSEQDAPAPLSVYGRTKMLAEAAIVESGVEHLIIRINVPLSPPEEGRSFYSFVVQSLKEGKPVKIVTDQWNNPLDTGRIAQWSWEAWQRGVRGILHLGGGTYATRFDIARLIADYVGADSSLVVPIRTEELNQAARRPSRGGLLIARQAELFGTPPDLPSILKSLPK